MSDPHKHISLADMAARRVIVLDGAFGTMLQALNLDEADFRGSLDGLPDCQLKGCNDLLCLSRPDIVASIHQQYLHAGADVIETNSFNSNAISMDEFHLAHMAPQMAMAAAHIARTEADAYMQATGRPVFVAGSVGPTSKSLTMAVSLGDDVTFDDMAAAYTDQIDALIEGGVDLLMIETIFDTLNAKAAIFAAQQVMHRRGVDLPIILSVTLTESGRTLSGQTLEAFVASTAHARPFAVGLNCGFGIDGMTSAVQTLQPLVDRVSLYANAGLPDQMGHYNESPESMAAKAAVLIERGLVNIIGGCCGTTPAHIAELARLVGSDAAKVRPQGVARPIYRLTLAGLEALTIDDAANFINVGERCNVAGSRKFLRLIKDDNLDEALDIARRQVADGAVIIDVNMDDGMLNAAQCMTTFLRRCQVDPAIASVPVMVDSSDPAVIIAALKCIQGKPVVNSISLKEGEQAMVARARLIQRYGAAMVVMAFDEQGQATTLARKIEICSRAYHVLTQAGIPASDIIFDPNILAVATGLPEHSRYAADFIGAVEWIKANLPGAKVSGGVSNLSFAFRGNDAVRQAMHSVFLAKAIAVGLDMAIVNAAALPPVDSIGEPLLTAVTDVIDDSDVEAADRLVAVAAECMEQKPASADVSRADNCPIMTLATAVESGITSGLEPLVLAEIERCGSPVAVINGPLMTAMEEVGRKFAAGRLFLPQVVRTAAAMQAAVAILTPLIESDESTSGDDNGRPKMVIATVRGDVHDIGKNIVSVIMRCNGFDVIDLGVMVAPEKIIQAAIDHHADTIGLSGLITPSLAEMCTVARMMDDANLSIPLFVGGATTSDRHTAIKIAPLYRGVVAHTADAAQLPPLVRRLLGPESQAAAQDIRTRQAALRQEWADRQPPLSPAEALARAPHYEFEPKTTVTAGTVDYRFDIDRLVPLINWRAFLAAWRIDASLAAVADIGGCDHCRAQWLAALPQTSRAKGSQAMQLIKDAHRALDYLSRLRLKVNARVVTAHASANPADGLIDITAADGRHVAITVIRQQMPGEGERLSLADFIAPADDYVGLFGVTVGEGIARVIAERTAADEYIGMVYATIADRLAEAATELAHRLTLKAWGMPDAVSIRPAVGYPSLPDQALVHILDGIIDYAAIGLHPTATGALSPAASTTGLIIAHPQARYFISTNYKV